MKVAALISGGVDSSVALCKLAAEKQHDITAFYLKIWLEDDLAYLGDCPWEEDLKFAHSVCSQLGVKLEVVSLQTEYWDRVVSYTIAELKAGHTPSPDIFCNQRVKFGAFLDKVDTDFEKVLTGHYATVRDLADKSLLIKGQDPVKDQTYFLSHLTQAQVRRSVFPLGELFKHQVRGLAKDYGLENQARPDSQGICFLGKIKFNDFVKFHLGEQLGPIVHIETGKTIGEHKGYWFHTIGQRKGLGMSGGPWFVVEKDISKNIVYVSHQESFLARASDCFYVVNPNWIDKEPEPNRKYDCKVRHGSMVYECTFSSVDGRLMATLAKADAGIATGQFCVVYDGDVCLGGGMIERLPSK